MDVREVWKQGVPMERQGDVSVDLFGNTDANKPLYLELDGSGYRLFGGSGAPFAKFSGHVRTTSQEIGFTSCGTANYGGMRGAIRKNIIGHGMRPGTWHAAGRGMAACREQISARGVLGSAVRTFALLDEPAGEHGGSVFLHPLIEQSANLLVEIGGVGKTGKFVALERIARRREKELPRRLGSWTGHDSLLRRIYAR